MPGSTLTIAAGALSKENQIKVVQEIVKQSKEGRFHEWSYTIAHGGMLTIKKENDTFGKMNFVAGSSHGFRIHDFYVGKRGSPIMIMLPDTAIRSSSGHPVKHVEVSLVDFVSTFQAADQIFLSAQYALSKSETIIDHAIPAGIADNPNPEHYGSW